MSKPASAIEVFTDGACAGNPGPGGWAWATAPDGAQRDSGGEAQSTNQRMEIMAVLQALRSLKGPLTIVSDSRWVILRRRDSNSSMISRLVIDLDAGPRALMRTGSPG